MLTLCIGRVEQGTLKVGDEISVVGAKPIPKTTVVGIEMFKKELDQAQAGKRCVASSSKSTLPILINT
jgi:elongation factor Tu